jgi:hypothetical protein
MAMISRLGWSLVNDSATNLFDGASDWNWVTPRPRDAKGNLLGTDWYFFGHGFYYKRAMLDFTKIAGKIPLVPRYSLGMKSLAASASSSSSASASSSSSSSSSYFSSSSNFYL